MKRSIVRHPKQPKEHWLEQKWGSLNLSPSQELPDEWSRASGKAYIFDCDCGRKTPKLPFVKVTHLNNQTCGKCSELSRDYWLQQKWGTLGLDPDQELSDEWGPSANFRASLICDCGRRSSTRFADLPRTQSCGACDFKSKDYWLQQVWSNLSLDPTQTLPEEWGIGHKAKMTFNCSCGRQLTTQFKTVREGSATSCNHCNDQPKDYWLQQRWGLLSLKPEQTLPDTWSYGSTRKYRLTCDCGNEICKSFRLATLGGLQSCGCNQLGRGPNSIELQIFNWLLEHFPDAQRNTKSILQPLELDVWIPSLQLGVEYHGLFWHSEGARRSSADYAKYLKSRERNIRLIQIYSDEPWQEILTQELLLPQTPKEGWIDNRFCNWAFQQAQGYICTAGEEPSYVWTDGTSRHLVKPITPRRWYRIWDSGRSYWQKPVGQ